eukprot:TRINITY_DN26460_c0_g1_i1.p1 TRINITY_DN26460_c0_g1~~TRINITY_DN26460_c0_g1_i1.p1  ORF type:complete len:394 (+),score=22.68 TRINITY_DN26460_c0_g1_i1:93-1184(+)
MDENEMKLRNGSVLSRACVLLFGILLACGTVFGVASAYSVQYPFVIGQAALAFTLGLRHAVDCDHLAAIDNVTRQLISRGQWPVSVGFWFALGHSTIVVAMTAMIAGGYTWVSHMTEATITSYVTLFAGLFSAAIISGLGLLNARIALNLFQQWVRLSSKSAEEHTSELEAIAAEAMQTVLSSIPCLKRAVDGVSQPSRMYFVGVLFGLSFDSATQVGLIGLSAMAGTHGTISPLVIMLLPACFSCGMCLVDTANGLLMLLTYSWASVQPIKKLFYNFLVTAISAAIALLISSLELLQIIGERFGFQGPFWNFVGSVDMASIGYLIILTFFVVLVLAVASSKGAAAARNMSCGGFDPLLAGNQ